MRYERGSQCRVILLFIIKTGSPWSWEGVINNHIGTTSIKQHCPRQTKLYGHPTFACFIRREYWPLLHFSASTFAPTVCKTLCSLPRRVSRHCTQPAGIPIPNGERVTYTNNANNLAVVLSPKRNMHWFKEDEDRIFLRINLPSQTFTCHCIIVLSELYRLELSECPFLALWIQGADFQEAPTVHEALFSTEVAYLHME